MAGAAAVRRVADWLRIAYLRLITKKTGRVFFVSEDGAGFMTGNRPDHALPVDSLADLLEQTEPGDVIQISGTIESLRLDGGKRK